MNIRGVIFDMDGVIFDSEAHSFRCFEKACEQTGHQFDEAWYMTTMGTVVSDTHRMGEEFYGKEDYWQIDAAFRRIFVDGYHNGEVPLKPGAYELISWLKDNHFPICLATSSRMNHVHDSFDNSIFGAIPFDLAVTGEDGALSKPDPDVFFKAAALLDLPPQDCLIIEDSLNGVKAAIAAGSISCMVPDLQQPDQFILDNVTMIKKDLFEVMEVLKPFVNP